MADYEIELYFAFERGKPIKELEKNQNVQIFGKFSNYTDKEVTFEIDLGAAHKMKYSDWLIRYAEGKLEPIKVPPKKYIEFETDVIAYPLCIGSNLALIHAIFEIDGKEYTETFHAIPLKTIPTPQVAFAIMDSESKKPIKNVSVTLLEDVTTGKKYPAFCKTISNDKPPEQAGYFNDMLEKHDYKFRFEDKDGKYNVLEHIVENVIGKIGLSVYLIKKGTTAQVTVKVLDANDKGISGAKVTLERTDNHYYKEGETDWLGRAFFTLVPYGDYKITAYHPMHGKAEIYRVVDELLETFEIGLYKKEAVLEIKVVDAETDVGIEGLKVILDDIYTKTTDAFGIASFTVYEEREYRYVVNPDEEKGYQSKKGTIEAEFGKTKRIVVSLHEKSDIWYWLTEYWYLFVIGIVILVLLLRR